MSAIWESANWTRQFGIRQTGNRQFGMLPFEDTRGVSKRSLKISTLISTPRFTLLYVNGHVFMW